MRIQYFNEFNTVITYIPIEDTYSIRYQKGKFKRSMGEFLFKLLSKIATVDLYSKPMENVKVERITIDYQEIEKMLWEHIESIRCIHNKDCRMIVLGHRQMRELGNELNSPMQFNFPYSYSSNSVYDNERLEFAGIEVSVVPWIDGVFAIPK